MNKTEIKTARLTLRPLTDEYLKTAHEYASDLENTRYMCYLPNETESETLDFLRHAGEEWEKPSPEFYEFAIIWDGHHIGAVSLAIGEGAGAGELGWIINKKYWRQGFATEAASALICFARSLGVRRLCAHCDAENTGSYRTMEKLGMKFVGRYPGRKNRCSDEERDELEYGLTLPERVKITAVRASRYDDLIEKYENPIEHACDISVGDVFYTDGERPGSLCAEAWATMEPFVSVLLRGGGNFFDGWMRDPHSAMVSCNDGFRPVSFYIEAIYE